MTQTSPRWTFGDYFRFALCYLSVLLRTLWLFTPPLLFLLLGAVAFWVLGQGHDIVRHCLSGGAGAGFVFIVAIVFWAFVTWYASRLIAYNHSELYHEAYTPRRGGAPYPLGAGLLFHFPRLMGWSVFMVVMLAIIQYEHPGGEHAWVWRAGMAADLAAYFVLHYFFDKWRLAVGGSDAGGQAAKGTIDNRRARRLDRARRAAWGVVALAAGAALLWWSTGSRNVRDSRWIIVVVLAVLQVCFLFLVLTRLVIAQWNVQRGRRRRYPAVIDRLLVQVLGRRGDAQISQERLLQDTDAERATFFQFTVISAVAGIFYVAAIVNMHLAISIGVMPFVFLAFGVLVGITGALSLISHRQKINLHFVLIALVFFAGCFVEPHRARRLPAAGLDYRDTATRLDLRGYLHTWLADSTRRAAINSDTAAMYPVFVVLADGGASRSGYWTTLVLSHLVSNTAAGKQPFLDHLFCLSGASGGSVGHGAFLAGISHEDLLRGGDTRLEDTTARLLGSDFLSFTLARMLGPDIAAPLLCPLFGGDRAMALERGLEAADETNGLSADMARGFAAYLPHAGDTGGRRLLPIVFFNTTRMQDGHPGVVSNIRLDATFGARLDVLDSLPPGTDLRLSTAMILSARFPYISPAGRIGSSYFVDGGYFDNSGAGVAHELLLGVQDMLRFGRLSPGDAALARRLQFYVIHITNTPYGEQGVSSVHPFKNDLMAPLLTLAGSYSSQTTVNDTRLTRYLGEINGGQRSTVNINLYKDDVQESFPMNWVISDTLRRKMKARVGQVPSLNAIIARLNAGRRTRLFDALEVNSEPQGVDTIPDKPLPPPALPAADSAAMAADKRKME